MQEVVEHRGVYRVTGEISPYAFKPDDGDDEIGGVTVRINGGVVTVSGIDPNVANRMKPGETWEFVGEAAVNGKRMCVKLINLVSAKRIAAARNQTVEFDFNLPQSNGALKK